MPVIISYLFNIGPEIQNFWASTLFEKCTHIYVQVIIEFSKAHNQSVKNR